MIYPLSILAVRSRIGRIHFIRSMLVHLLTAVYYNPHGKGKVSGRNKWAGIVTPAHVYGVRLSLLSLDDTNQSLIS